MLARERPAVGRSLTLEPYDPLPPSLRGVRIVGLGGPPRYEEHPTARLVACSDVWFKCYTYLLQ
jgi:hypothetical protein